MTPQSAEYPDTVDGCPFCAIVRGAAPAEIIARKGRYVVFSDIAPQAPLHLLVIPTKHVPRLSVFAEDAGWIGELVRVAARYGSELAPGGFRVLINEGPQGHQTVDHVHVHVLGGRQLQWPPG